MAKTAHNLNQIVEAGVVLCDPSSIYPFNKVKIYQHLEGSVSIELVTTAGEVMEEFVTSDEVASRRHQRLGGLGLNHTEKAFVESRLEDLIWKEADKRFGAVPERIEKPARVQFEHGDW